MKTLAVVLAISGATQAGAASPLPPEVRSYIEDRDLCEHLRQESFEGSTPEQVERRRFLQESIEIHCAGTDRRLAALKKRYSHNHAVMSRLENYEVASEGGAAALIACAGSLRAEPAAAIVDLKPGLPYSRLRHALVLSGWSPVDAVMPVTAAPHAYRELTCGQGYDAACSATYRSKQGAICLIMTATTEQPVLASHTDGEC